MKFIISACAAVAALGAASASAAQERLAVGAGYGSDGVGLSVEFKASDRFILRGAVDHLYFDDDVKIRSVDYSSQVDTTWFTGEVQYHPWKNALFVGAGVVLGDRVVEYDGRPAGPVKIGGRTFTPEQVGRLKGEVDFGGTVPLLEVGLDSTFRAHPRLGLRLAAGVAVGETPSVDLESVGGTFSLSPRFQTRLDDEAAEIQSDLEPLRYYPVVAAEMTWRF
ncbi:hypothetical protein [Caulobacter sp. 17J80-11]|uniref:hypothetical protein n=1 Tax=Caulobacter sp. 17J80-11 TaxID=2763502 RepID=UPI001653BAE9|nr:hypothetical protein [Caulobacter sp. 17J80-11]MBC6980327.1 hypothetical protein [Caulobacter sp. 17J80-11]